MSLQLEIVSKSLSKRDVDVTTTTMDIHHIWVLIMTTVFRTCLFLLTPLLLLNKISKLLLSDLVPPAKQTSSKGALVLLVVNNYEGIVSSQHKIAYHSFFKRYFNVATRVVNEYHTLDSNILMIFKAYLVLFTLLKLFTLLGVLMFLS